MPGGRRESRLPIHGIPRNGDEKGSRGRAMASEDHSRYHWVMLPRRILLLFVDGVGLGDRDPATNPFARAATPTLRRLLGARLGVPGLPQSATGQTALLSGENAAALLGRHLTAYPTPSLRHLLAARGLFVRLHGAGVQAALANAYTDGYFAAVAQRRLRHASITLNAIQAGVRLRDLADLRAGRAVYHDLTNAGLRRQGLEIPLVTPEDAGHRLAAIVRAEAFTVFEFFQTDLAAHGRAGEPIEVIERYDRMLGAALDALDLGETLVLMTSDHGNLEDGRTTAHTLNPVPALLVGAGRDALASRLGAITDVVPTCLDLWSAPAPVPLA